MINSYPNKKGVIQPILAELRLFLHLPCPLAPFFKKRLHILKNCVILTLHICFCHPELLIFPMKREKCPKDKKGAPPPRCSNILAREGSQKHCRIPHTLFEIFHKRGKWQDQNDKKGLWWKTVISPQDNVFVILNCEFSRWNGKNVRRTKRGRHRRGAVILLPVKDLKNIVVYPTPFLRFFISGASGRIKMTKRGSCNFLQFHSIWREKISQVFAPPDGLTETRKRHKQI